jgi:hypothetical protein
VALIDVQVLSCLLHVLVNLGLLLDDVCSQLKLVHLDHTTVDDFGALLNSLGWVETIIGLDLVLLKLLLELVHLVDAVLDIFIRGVVPNIVFEPQGAKALIARLQGKEVRVTELELLGNLHAFSLTHDD